MTASQPESAPPPHAAGGDTSALASPLAEALTRASWRLRRTSVKELAPLGLTFAQSRVLRILTRRDEPMRMGDLAARFEVAPRSTTSMIDSLEALGLVERRADPTDRRSVLVGLTADGLALMERMGTLRRASAETLFGRLTPAQQQQLLDLLTVLNEPDDECGTAPIAGADGAGGGAGA
jgi:DNA-binding MarR family transcriptional regulator